MVWWLCVCLFVCFFSFSASLHTVSVLWRQVSACLFSFTSFAQCFTLPHKVFLSNSLLTLLNQPSFSSAQTVRNVTHPSSSLLSLLQRTVCIIRCSSFQSRWSSVCSPRRWGSNNTFGPSGTHHISTFLHGSFIYNVLVFSRSKRYHRVPQSELKVVKLNIT